MFRNVRFFLLDVIGIQHLLGLPVVLGSAVLWRLLVMLLLNRHLLLLLVLRLNRNLLLLVLGLLLLIVLLRWCLLRRMLIVLRRGRLILLLGLLLIMTGIHSGGHTLTERHCRKQQRRQG